MKKERVRPLASGSAVGGTTWLSCLGLLCSALAVACSGESPVAEAGVATAQAPARAATSRAAESASHEVRITGAHELSIQGDSAVAGARFGSFHFSFAGQPDGTSEPVIISLARVGDAPPQAGTFRLGKQGDFDGNVEIHPGPEDYAIEEGELIISGADGNTLGGSYAFTARERFGDAAISVEGSFSARLLE